MNVLHSLSYKLCEIHSFTHEGLAVHSDGPCLYVKRSDIQVKEVGPKKSSFLSLIQQYSMLLYYVHCGLRYLGLKATVLFIICLCCENKNKMISCDFEEDMPYIFYKK